MITRASLQHFLTETSRVLSLCSGDGAAAVETLKLLEVGYKVAKSVGTCRMMRGSHVLVCRVCHAAGGGSQAPFGLVEPTAKLI